MTGKRTPKMILPPGAVWETRTMTCLKCRRPFESRGYRYIKSGVWIGKHLCPHCNEANEDVKVPRMAKWTPIGMRVEQ